MDYKEQLADVEACLFLQLLAVLAPKCGSETMDHGTLFQPLH